MPRKSKLTTKPVINEEKLETERARLMAAHSLLQLIVMAMSEADGAATDGPYYPTLIEMARDLIDTAIKNLDIVSLRKGPKQS